MTNMLTITITQQQIDRANAAREIYPDRLGSICPIAQAMRDAGQEYVLVAWGVACARTQTETGEYTTYGTQEWTLSAEGRAFAHDWDNGYPVTPTTIQLEELEELEELEPAGKTDRKELKEINI